MRLESRVASQRGFQPHHEVSSKKSFIHQSFFMRKESLVFMRSLQNGTHEMDMCNGPLIGKILRFSIPIILTGILQLLYNAADIIVVGRFTGATALAAVGSTSSLISLIVNAFIGLSVGTGVAVARNYGAGDMKGVSSVLHTSIALSVVAGVVVAIVGIVFSHPLLELMGSPQDVIDQASLYLKIYFVGIPFSMVYNYSAAALRAIGDTRRPLYYLTISGLVNVALNLFLVIVFHLGVAGVAIATAISQVVSTVLILSCLLRSDSCIRLNPRKIRFELKALIDIVKIGLPAGLQSSVFSISNVLIQSSINSFGSSVMAANAAAGNLEGFVYTAMNAISQAALTFTGQNIGAKKYRRIPRIMGACCLLVTLIGITSGVVVYAFSNQLLALYTSDPEVIIIGRERLLYTVILYFLCGLMEVVAGMLRGCGYSVTPMIVSLLGACGLRILWIYTAFAAVHTLPMLYVSYPISWFLTVLAHSFCFLIIWRKLKKTECPTS